MPGSSWIAGRSARRGAGTGWSPWARVWGYLAGLILLVAGVGMVTNKRARLAAFSIGALMTFLTLGLYLAFLVLAVGGSVSGVNDALNNVADTLLYAGSALALASALPREST